MADRRSGLATLVAAVAGAAGLAAALWAVRRSTRQPRPQLALPPPRTPLPPPAPPEPETTTPEATPAVAPDTPIAMPPPISGIGAAAETVPEPSTQTAAEAPQADAADEPAPPERPVDSYNVDLVETVMEEEARESEADRGFHDVGPASALLSEQVRAARFQSKQHDAWTSSPVAAAASLPPRDDWSTLPAVAPVDVAIEAVAALLGDDAAPPRAAPERAGDAVQDAEPAPGEEGDPAIQELDRIATSVFGEQPPDLPPIVVPAPANPMPAGKAEEAETSDEGRLAALFGQMGDRSAGAAVPDEPPAQVPAEPVDAAPPPDPAATALLEEGNAFFNVGQYSLAIERYTGALDRSPRLVAALYNRGNAYARRGDLDRARADYDRAIDLLPGDADALNNRGMVHLYRGDYRAAKSDFDRAVDLAPDDMTILVNRGLAWLHVGQPERAMIDFRYAMEHAPSDGAAYYGGAQAAVGSGDFGSALEYLRQAFTIDHTYVREAAADPMLADLDGYEPFHRLLRQFGARP